MEAPQECNKMFSAELSALKAVLLQILCGTKNPALASANERVIFLK